jgi:ribosomal protein S18 acetylase RimI-like enzyme
MWRLARPEDDDRIVELCLALYTEDPSPEFPTASQVHGTLEELRRRPGRGVAALLELDGRVEGYALLISFWSNEFGGELCDVDELYVAPDHRSRGHGRELFDTIERGGVWPGGRVGISLQVTPDNQRASALYERLGFRPMGTAMVRRRTR